MWVTEDGTISGWNAGTAAVIMVNTKSASVFKGAALATLPNHSGGMSTFLYVADFRKGRIQVFDQSFNHVFWIENAFADDEHNGNGHGDDNHGHIPRGFAPFNVQNIGGDLYVTFAKQDAQKHDEVDGAGLGYVQVFSPTGQFELPAPRLVAQRSPGASPWRRETSVSIATTCWSASSAPATSPSTIPPPATSKAC